MILYLNHVGLLWKLNSNDICLLCVLFQEAQKYNKYHRVGRECLQQEDNSAVLNNKQKFPKCIEEKVFFWCSEKHEILWENMAKLRDCKNFAWPIHEVTIRKNKTRKYPFSFNLSPKALGQIHIFQHRFVSRFLYSLSNPSYTFPVMLGSRMYVGVCPLLFPTSECTPCPHYLKNVV